MIPLATSIFTSNAKPTKNANVNHSIGSTGSIKIILLSKTSETKSKIRIWGAIKIYLNNVLPILEEIRKIKYEEMFVDSVHFSDVNGGSKEKFVLKSKKNNIQSFCYEYEEGRIMKKNFTNVTKPKKQKRKRKKKVVKASIQEFDANEVQLAVR